MKFLLEVFLSMGARLEQATKNPSKKRARIDSGFISFDFRLRTAVRIQVCAINL
jgi:hypothetical protein